MSEFTFDCPSCGQHILASTEWTGRKMTCPSCDATFAIPLPSHAPVVESPDKDSSPKPAPRRPKVRMRVKIPSTARAAGGKARPPKGSTTDATGRPRRKMPSRVVRPPAS